MRNMYYDRLIAAPALEFASRFSKLHQLEEEDEKNTSGTILRSMLLTPNEQSYSAIDHIVYNLGALTVARVVEANGFITFETINVSGVEVDEGLLTATTKLFEREYARIYNRDFSQELLIDDIDDTIFILGRGRISFYDAISLKKTEYDTWQVTFNNDVIHNVKFDAALIIAMSLSHCHCSLKFIDDFKTRYAKDHNIVF